jgi:hypothetical protein
MDRLSVLLHIPRILDQCGDVPIQMVMYVLSGHDGSVDSRGSQEDTLWKLRDDQYDTIGPDEIREKARIARIVMRAHPEDGVSLKVLSIVANGNEAAYEEMRTFLLAARTRKEQKRHDVLEGLPVSRQHDDNSGLNVNADINDDAMNAMSGDDSMEDALGELA